MIGGLTADSATLFSDDVMLQRAALACPGAYLADQSGELSQWPVRGNRHRCARIDHVNPGRPDQTNDSLGRL